jgi:hypothetical protein
VARDINYPNFTFNWSSCCSGYGQPIEPLPFIKGDCLFTEAELADDLTVSINVFTIEVVKKTAALAYHFQQAASATVVVLVLA